MLHCIVNELQLLKAHYKITISDCSNYIKHQKTLACQHLATEMNFKF